MAAPGALTRQFSSGGVLTIIVEPVGTQGVHLLFGLSQEAVHFRRILDLRRLERPKRAFCLLVAKHHLHCGVQPTSHFAHLYGDDKTAVIKV